MHAELTNLRIFVEVLGKVLLETGLGPGIAIVFLVHAMRKFWTPLEEGHCYRVRGYHTGDFVGKVERVDASVALFLVRDPLRRIPKAQDRCSMKQCILEDFHEGDHQFDPVRPGAQLIVYWRNAKFEEVA